MATRDFRAGKSKRSKDKGQLSLPAGYARPGVGPLSAGKPDAGATSLGQGHFDFGDGRALWPALWALAANQDGPSGSGRKEALAVSPAPAPRISAAHVDPLSSGAGFGGGEALAAVRHQEAVPPPADHASPPMPALAGGGWGEVSNSLPLSPTPAPLAHGHITAPSPTGGGATAATAAAGVSPTPVPGLSSTQTPLGLPTETSAPPTTSSAALQTSAVAQPASSAGTLNLSGYSLVFDAEFNTLNLRSASNPNGTFDTWYPWGRSLPSNGEQEFYIDPSYDNLGVSPFSVNNGVLTISATPTPSNIAADVNNLPYLSGMLSTANTFSQTYGYFQITAELPAGQGLWPAFWMLPANLSWPPEIDVMEMLGSQPTTDYTTIHYGANDTSVGQSSTVATMTTGFNTYGVDWEPSTITFYVNGQQVFQTATPAGMNVPMFLLANLAVGGSWPGDPNSSTQFPANMQISSIQAYASPNTIANVNTNPAAGVSPIPAPATWTGDPPASATPVAEVAGGTTPSVLFAESVATEFYSPSGQDVFVAGSGDDTFLISKSEQIILPSVHGIETIDWYGGSATYTLQAGITDFYAYAAGTIIGNSGSIRMVANSGGGSTLVAGSGTDLLVGNGAAATFVITGGGGNDAIAGFASGDLISIVNSYASFAAAQANMSQVGANVVLTMAGGQTLTLRGVTLSALTASEFAFSTPTTPPPPAPSWAAGGPGIEGGAVALGALVSGIGAGYSLASLTISGAPAGAVLSDGHGDSVTSTGPGEAINVGGWTLSSLTVTPTNDANFTLTATATQSNGGLVSAPASATETVTIDPTAPTLTWAATVAGAPNTNIALGSLAATITGLSGDGNSLKSLTISGAPTGAVLSDGHGHSQTSTGTGAAINVSGWTLSSLTIDTATSASFTLTAAATEADADGDVSASATASEAVIFQDQWTNSRGGNWTTASSWSTGVPTATVAAAIAASGTYTVTISAADTALALTVSDAGATVTDNSGGTLTLAGTGGAGAPNGALTVTAGTFTLNGGKLKAGAVTVGGGANVLVSSGSYTGTNALSEAITDNGTVTVANSASVALGGAVTGGGAMIVENRASLVLNGAVSGTGSLTIANSATLELAAADSEAVTFASGSTGKLKLDHTASFTGTVAGLTTRNQLDLADLKFVSGHMTASFSGTAAGGTLTVSDGSQTDKITLVGNYLNSKWNLSRDSSGDTTVIDPPATATGMWSAALFNQYIAAGLDGGHGSGGQDGAHYTPPSHPQPPSLAAAPL